MDYCRNETLALFKSKNLEGHELRIILYKVFVPILLVGCLLSIVLNSILVAVGNISRHTRGNRSPILVLSLNLAVTDALASALNGVSLVLNSFLPVVLGIKIRTPCITLTLEILRMSSLIASALHLLALAMIHYKGIVNPLHYRSVMFCSHHLSRSIHLMTLACWLMPAIIFTTYFSLIPCQGFSTATCGTEFILTFRFRFMVVMGFFIPLFIMSFLYIRIFSMIKKHQEQRAVGQRNRSMRSDFSQTKATSSPLVITRMTDNTPMDSTMTSQRSLQSSQSTEDLGNVPPLNIRARHQRFAQSKLSSLIVSSKSKQTSTKTVVFRQAESKHSRRLCACMCCHKKAPVASNNASSSRLATLGNTTLSFDSVDTAMAADSQSASCCRPRAERSQRLDTPSTSNKGNAKALVTTLLILGTYVICWIPAVLFFALTCIDYCPFPINYINFRDRVIIGFIVNGLVILKAIIDPLIYTYRMKEMKTALNRCFGHACPMVQLQVNRKPISNCESSTANSLNGPSGVRPYQWRASNVARGLVH